jgi:hypothetical protein
MPDNNQMQADERRRASDRRRSQLIAVLSGHLSIPSRTDQAA